MRKVVVFEGRPYPDGRTIKPGALRVEDERIPVRVVGDDEEWPPGWPIAYATGFERDTETGEISFEIELARESKIDLEKVGAAVTLTEYKADLATPLDIEEGLIREIVLF